MARVQKNLVVSLASRTFANDRLQVVATKTGYWLYSIPDDKYYFLSSLDGNSCKVGKLVLNPRIVSKDPLIKSDTNFTITHVDGSDRYVVGSLEVDGDKVTFRKGLSGNPVVDIYLD